MYDIIGKEKEDDMGEKIMEIIVEEYQFSRNPSFVGIDVIDNKEDNAKNISNSLATTFIGENENENKEIPLIEKKTMFYFKNFMVLKIQYFFILLLTICGFIFKFNERLINFHIYLELKFIPIIAFIFLSILILMAFCPGAKSENFVIIFHAFYPIFINYYSFLFSEYIDSKYIIIGLSLIMMEIFSLSINIICKKFEIKYI